MKKATILITAIAVASAVTACGKKSKLDYAFKYQKDPAVQELLDIAPDYPTVKFAVFADSHYHDKALGTSGKAFKEYLEGDRKLLHLTEELLEEGVSMIKGEKPAFVLVAGDLTKDGEKLNHEKVRQNLDSLAAVTPKIYVIPGNHDVSNGEAHKYTGDSVEKVETVSPDDFKKMYAKYGYGNPVAADETSLSYVAEPVPGLWVLALDSCLWRDNEPDGHPVTDGEFATETLAWLEDTLIRSKKEKKALVAFMHHGAMEHYPYNEKFYGGYVVNHFDQISDLFAAYGVKMVFTGHYHAQDITMKKLDDGKFVYDIETGSFVTYPCPFRVVTIDGNQKAAVESRFITAIPSMGDNFKKYAYDFVFSGTVTMADDALEGYRVSKKDMKVLSPEIALAYVTHLSGDEKKPETMLTTDGIGIMGKLVAKFQGNLIKGWYSDLPPADNHIVIDLKSGEWEKIGAARGNAR